MKKEIKKYIKKEAMFIQRQVIFPDIFSAVQRICQYFSHFYCIDYYQNLGSSIARKAFNKSIYNMLPIYFQVKNISTFQQKSLLCKNIIVRIDRINIIYKQCADQLKYKYQKGRSKMLEYILSKLEQCKIQEVPLIIDEIRQLLIYQQNDEYQNRFNQKLIRFLKNYVPEHYHKDFKQILINPVKSSDYLKNLRQYVPDHHRTLKLEIIVHIQIEDTLSNEQIGLRLERQIKKNIKRHFQKCSNIQQFIQSQLGQIMDILHRRGSLGDYLDILVAESRWETNSLGLGSVCRSMTLTDLTVLLLRATAPSNAVPLLLAQQSAAVPISYAAQGKLVNDERLLSALFGPRTFPIVLNIWTPKAAEKLSALRVKQSKEKAYFCELLGVDPKSFEGSAFEGVVNLFRVRLRGGREILLVSTISYGSDQQTQAIFQAKRSLIQRLKNFASLLVFHIDEDISIDNMYDFSLVDPFSCNKKIFITQLASKIKNQLNNLLEYYPSFKDQEFYFFQTYDQQSSSFENHQFDRLKQYFNKFLLENKNQQLSTLALDNHFTYKKKQFEHFFEKFDLNYMSYQVQNLVPNYINMRQLKKGKQKMKELRGKQKSLNQQQKKKKQLEDQYELVNQTLKTSSLSSFVLQSYQLIKKYGDNSFELFIQLLIKKNTTKINKKIQQLKLLFPTQVNQRQKSFKDQERKILERRITIDNIIEEISIHNELVLSTNVQRENSHFQVFINEYYQKCLAQLRPFALINGETSNFGNEGLRRFFKRLNERYDRAKVFVVSVIGTKDATGKSALLNYLFRYNTAFIEDPYAKGVYMSLCKIDNKTIVVLDALGVMALDFNSQQRLKYDSQQLGRLFATFDHQIASLLMKQSDIVVISSLPQDDLRGKQESENILKQIYLTLAICYQVLHSLHLNNSEEYPLPKNIIFVFSDQLNLDLDKKSIINTMIETIQPIITIDQSQQGSINKKDQFQKYIRLEQENIFFLPKINKKQYFTSINQEFGLSVLVLRQRVLNILQFTFEPRTIVQFYGDCDVNWSIILRTANKNMIQAKSVNQSNKKLLLQEIYKAKISIITQKIVGLIQQRYPVRFDDVRREVNQLIRKNYQQNKYMVTSFYFQQFIVKKMIKKYKSQQQKYKKTDQDIVSLAFKLFFDEAIKKVEHIQWIKQYLINVKQLANSIFIEKSYSYYQKFKEQFDPESQNKFILLIKKIKRTLKQNKIKNQQLRIMLFQQKLQQIVDYAKIDRKEIRQNLTRTLNIAFQSQDVFLRQLQVTNIQECIDFERSIKIDFNNLNKLIYFLDQDSISSIHKQSLQYLLSNRINIFCQNVKKISKGKKITFDADFLFDQMKKQISSTIISTSSIIRQMSNQIYSNPRQMHIIQEKINTRKNQINKMIQQSSNSQKLVRQKVYLQKILEKTALKFQEKIKLNKINYKIILLAKLLDVLQESIYQQVNKENMEQIILALTYMSRQLSMIFDDL